LKPVIVLFFILLFHNVFAQTDSVNNSYLQQQTDVSDLKAKFLHLKPHEDSIIHKLQKLFIPTFSYNPSTGFEVGVRFSALIFLGNPDSTSLSNGTISLAASTKGLAYINYKHNIYLPRNKWSLQGNWQVGRTQLLDYGIGTGHSYQDEPLYGPSQKAAHIFALKYTSFCFSEKAYKKIADNLFGGIGLNFNVYTAIDNSNDEKTSTYHYRYSVDNGFTPGHYLANSISFNLQFDTRDHPNRPYKGIYANMGLKTNQKTLGSTENAVQLTTGLRKYWSLSATNPQHVLAFWHWGSYLLSGKLPYLELPGTGTDADQRSGRAYTIGRFKGTSFFYSELEYRFPILSNSLISGVTFLNAQTANSQSINSRLFQYWEPGAGAGIRILYDKHSRSNICIDYGIGHYGANGFYVNLNETF